MNYEIIKLYTEKLDVSSFNNIINDTKIDSIAKFNTSLVPSTDSTSLFIMEYTMRAINQPISLNWVGIAILKLEDSGHDKLNDKILLDDDKIEKFINDSMEKFSFFLGAKIPNIVDQIKENKND